MSRLFLTLYSLCLFLAGGCFADNIVWKGDVLSDGTPTAPIPLVLHQQYQIKVSGFVNLGKWIQNREELADDACFEFNKETSLSKSISLRNSNDISVCDGHYHPDHVYQSAPFIAKQEKIHFWVHDTTYSDNKGAFQVQVIHIPGGGL